MSRQVGESGANLFDDLGEADLRRQRIADNGNIDAMGTRPFRDEGKGLLLIALPIAAMNKDEQRRLRRTGWEIVKAGPRPGAIGDVELGAARCAHCCASLTPA